MLSRMLLGVKPAIEYVGYTSATGLGSTGASVNVPAGTRQSDLMVVCLASESGATQPFTAPSGFTELVNVILSAGDRMGMYYKLGGVPTSSFTVYGNSTSNDSGAIVAVFRNVNAYNAFGYQTYASTGSNSTLARTCPDISSGVGNLQLFMLGKDTGAASDVMTPSQGTKIAQVNAQTIPDETVVCLAWNLGTSSTSGTCLWSTSGTVGTAYGAATATFS